MMGIDELFAKINNSTEDFLKQLGINPDIAHLVNVIVLSACVAILAILANYIAKRIIIRLIKRWVDKSENPYDDIFYEKGVFNKLSHLAPALVIAQLAPIPLNDFPSLIGFIITATNVYVLVVMMMVLFSTINALQEIYDQTPMGKQRSIKGYVQVVKSVIYFVGALMLISIVFKKDLSSLFAGLTAFAAVLMFVFKDAILGLVAGIQISSNDLIRLGDYIEIPSKNIEGNVIDIKLSVVKILNTNKTISILPVYYFVSDSYHNWRGLDTADGRRMKRSVNLDMRTVRFADTALIEKIKTKGLLPSSYTPNTTDTNAKLFRLHLMEYLKETQFFNTNMTFIVRYLQPTENGLPLEVYAYTKDKDFNRFETIQSEVFEYIIATAPSFELAIYQRA
ncbi:MAG TPA: mechanosensitive ion channel [Bacteroidales bacterium]|nr:mechanosensitive ion channel [Bacteroidales bacterium]HOK98155.1 mechanosensitive ion channel [Bacteroidales bacterium]HPO65266.1 mechanosensitive ion channel [Bacteroidales bacterium]